MNPTEPETIDSPWSKISCKPKIPVKLLSPEAKVPTKGSAGAAGYDLYASQPSHLSAGEMGVIRTGVSMAIPEGWYGRVAPRSGLAMKYEIDVLAGVVDSDYRGEINVLLKNLGTIPVSINVGDRIAQLIIERCLDADLLVVEDLEESSRGTDGFGSTGR